MFSPLETKFTKHVRDQNNQSFETKTNQDIRDQLNLFPISTKPISYTNISHFILSKYSLYIRNYPQNTVTY